MRGALQQLESTPPVFAPAREAQDEALRELDEALALLSAPQDPAGDGDDAPQEQGAEEGDDASGEGEEEGSDAANQDPAQLLQGVRDREAQRQRDRARRSRSGYETVEKDW